ncbi:MAG: hypothetical protein U1E56_01535 [Bauldia sp.]
MKRYYRKLRAYKPTGNFHYFAALHFKESRNVFKRLPVNFVADFAMQHLSHLQQKLSPVIGAAFPQRVDRRRSEGRLRVAG